jgi:hypothetical protein
MRALGWDAEPATIDASRARCSIDTPVRLNRLQLNGVPSRSVEFPDRPVIACRFAIRFGQWVRELAAPLTLGRLGTELKAIQTGAGFECRTRNHIPNAKISAHASGIAVDIAGFDLASGQHVAVTESTNEGQVQLLSAPRISACGWFTTILGPGTDPEHATHWHFDILQHGSSDYYRICQ